jgi:hypothetical protein
LEEYFPILEEVYATSNDGSVPLLDDDDSVQAVGIRPIDDELRRMPSGITEEQWAVFNIRVAI